jgi:hypothetical protein
MASPPGLGDTKTPEFQLRTEEHALPLGGRKELIARIETLLTAGGVQKLVVERDRPIKLWRLVPKNELDQAPPELPADDLWNRLHNGEMQEMETISGAAPGVVGPVALLHAFHLVQKRSMRPAVLFTPALKTLRRWCGLPKDFDVSTLFGVEVAAQADLPTDASILVATSFDELNYDVFGIRIPMDLPKEAK